MRPGTLTSCKHLGTPLSQPASSTRAGNRMASPGLLGSSGRRYLAGDTSTNRWRFVQASFPFPKKRDRYPVGEHPCDDSLSWKGIPVAVFCR